MTRTSEATCTCGKVRIALTGEPIMTVECGCTSCQTAGATYEPSELTAHGLTPYAMVRKDRAALVSGRGSLVENRLTPDSQTRRITAACCGAPMYLEFEKGHWLSIYSTRLSPEDRAPLYCRTMTGDLPDRSILPTDVPNPKQHTLGFMARLMGAWIKMGFRVPAIAWTRETP